MRRFIIGGGLVAAGLLGPAPALSQEAAAPASAQAPALSSTAALDKVKAHYADVATFEVCAKRYIVDHTGTRDPESPMVKVEIAYKAPASLLIKSPTFRLVSDGEHTAIVLDREESFIRIAAPERLSSGDLHRRSIFFSDAKVYPIVDLLADAFDAEPARVKQDVIDGRPVLNLIFKDPYPINLYADAETGRLVRSRYPYNADASLMLQVDYRDEKLNGELAADRFSTSAPDSFFDKTEMAKRVDPNYYYNHAMEKVGDPAPHFALTSLEGKKVSLDGARGKVVVLDFWATYCAPCIQSIPAVEEAMKQLDTDKVELWGMNRDFGHNRRKLIEDFISQYQISTDEQLLVESEELPLAYHADLMPTWVIIDQEGVIRDYITGPISDGDELLRRVEPLLKSH